MVHIIFRKIPALTIFLSCAIFIILAIFFHTHSSQKALALQDLNPQTYAKDKILVKYKKNISTLLKNKLHQDLGTRALRRVERLNVEEVTIPEGRVAEFINRFKNSPLVEYAEVDGVATATMASNDPYLSNQWGLFTIKAADNTNQSAWDITTGATSVKVAVLDTGIEESHPDLLGKVTLSKNFTSTQSVQDSNGHGTHVAGIIATTTNNGVGVAGTGYNTSLMNGKALDNNGSGYYSWITNAIIWAADNGANVINMSLGGSAPSQTLQAAVDYAWSKGVVVVAAAGNDGNSAASYPGYYTNVIAVAATDINDSKASWSNYGSWVDVAAPGVSIYSTYKGGYAYLSGTSMATPFTAGLASLIYAKGECSTNTCVRNKIESSADHIMGTGNYFTHGRINAYNAVSSSSYNEATPTPTLTTAPTPIESGPTPTPTATPTPTQIPANTMTVSEITMWYTVARNYRYVYTKVRVVSSTNSPVKGATVKLTLKDPSGNNFTYSKNTNINGEITINRRSNLKGTFTSTVTNIIKSGITYNPTNITQTLLVQ